MKLMLVLKPKSKFIFAFTENIFIQYFWFYWQKHLLGLNRKYAKIDETFRLQNDLC